MFKILVLEDDKELNRTVCTFLNNSGYEAVGCLNANEAYDALYENMIDLIVSDIMMPGVDGFEFAKNVRDVNSEIPILFMTARDDIASKQRGFRIGVDDYMVKPFDAKEVVARIKAVLRRCQNSSAAAESTEGVIEFDNLRLDMNSYELRVKGKVVEAPPKELELLNCLASHPNRVYTRDQLLDEVWGFEYYGDSRTIDVHVKRLREKLAGASDKWELKTVWGVGYKFEVRQ